MSKIKEYYHEQIVDGTFDDAINEDEKQFLESMNFFKENKAKYMHGDEVPDEVYLARAEEAEFFRIFELTGTYPM